MAFNWDKLCKAQRDYPKPKFALDAIGKLLKKRPNDPYVLTWKTSVLLQHDGRAKEVLPILIGLCQQQPPITDLPLLSLIYRNLLEASQKVETLHPHQSSVGTEGLKAWQNAAKVLATRRAKMKLWSDLFVTAMRVDCWEDARYAIVQANKEGPDSKSKKAVYYALVLANQLAAEKKVEASRVLGKVDPGSKIQFTLALRQIKDAYDNSPKPTDESIQISSMSDLRFMATIYQRQNRCTELFELWEHPPPAIKKIIDSHIRDFELLKVDVAHEQKEWKLLEKTCTAIISRIWQQGDPTSVSDLLYDLRTSILKQKPGGRFFRCLTILSFASYLDEPNLENIKQFYFSNFRAPSCFNDLRRFVALLPVDEQRDFQSAISEHARGLAMEGFPKDASESKILNDMRTWHDAEERVLEFELLMIVSIPYSPDPALLEKFVGNALRLWRIKINTSKADAQLASSCIRIALQALIHLINVESRPRYLYQAATLVRYAISLDPQHQGRFLGLMSARIHLKLGLGSFAFEQYGLAKVKEMLHDTVSWVLLARISQSHPYSVTGPRGFSADAELEKVITAISRMEDRTDDLLYAGIQQFRYDKALDLLDLKNKLRLSLTKQFCITERRRIARFKGEPVDRSLDLPLRDQDNISDNCDWTAIPFINHFPPGAMGPLRTMDRITKLWVYKYRILVNITTKAVFKELSLDEALNASAPYLTQWNLENPATLNDDADTHAHFHPTELGMFEKVWMPISSILYALTPTGVPMIKFESLGNAFEVLFAKLKQEEKDLGELYQKFTDSSLKCFPYFSEERLAAMYGRLEALRVLNRLTDWLRPISKQPAHPLYREITVSKCNLLQENINEIYRLIQLNAQAAVDRLKRDGVDHIREQIAWGETGAAIFESITDETLDQYSMEYVDSATFAVEGILKVRLG
ncbi:hypothetical protein N0V90_002992 [Kalmusia sp. IMI 367209]|nr:hypothetical protein N0V90_002992 [Kalmusia sp. IMI 367209]